MIRHFATLVNVPALRRVPLFARHIFHAELPRLMRATDAPGPQPQAAPADFLLLLFRFGVLTAPREARDQAALRQ